MKIHLARMALFVILLSAAGCFSLEQSSLTVGEGKTVLLPDGETTADGHIVVSNFGWYLFNRYPIVCGNAMPNRRCPWVFFRNDVNEDLLQRRLMNYATASGCDVHELNVFNNEEALMTIGVGGLSLPLPYIVTFRDLQYSGVLVKREKATPFATPREQMRHEMKSLNSEMKKLLDRIPDGDQK